MKIIVKSALTRVSARLAAAILQAATLILLARQIDPAEFGIFGQAQSLGMLAAGILGFGFSPRSLVIAGRSDAKAQFSAMYILRIMAAALTFLLLTLGFTLSQKYLLIGVLAAAAVLFSDMIADLTQGILSGTRQHGLAAALLIIHRLIPLLCIIFALAQQQNPFLFLVVSSIATALLSLWPALTFRARPANLGSVLKQGSGFWFASVSAPVIQLDTSIVRTISDLASVGLYAAAARMGSPVTIVISSLVNILVPEMARAADNPRKYEMFARLRRLSILIALLLALASFPIAKLAIFLLGEAYQPALVLMCSVIAGAGLSGVNQTYQAYFFALHQPRAAGLAILFGTLAGLAALAVGGSLWGLPGLALGPIAVQAAIMLLFMVFEKNLRYRLLSEENEQEKQGAPRPVVLHVTESMGSGVEAVIRDYALNAPDYDHHLLFTTRGFRTGDGLGAFKSITETYGGKLNFHRDLQRRIGSIKPDIVHLHSSWAGLIGRLSFLQRAFALVYSPHSFFFSRTTLRRPWRWVAVFAERILGKRTDVIGAVSPHERDQGRSLGIETHYVPHFVPNNSFEKTAESGSRTGALPKVATVGRICAQKDPQFFLATKRAAEKHGLRAEWVWVGGGDKTMRDQLEQEGVVVTGWVDRASVISQMKSVDVYIHTAAWEGAPVSLLEAEAMGVPSAARSIQSVVSLGYPADLDTPERLATSAIQLINSKPPHVSPIVLNDFHRAAQEAALTTLYDRAINRQQERNAAK